MENVPVVFVHGIWKDSTAFRTMAEYLQCRGFQTFAIDLSPNDGSAQIEDLAEQLSDFVRTIGGGPVDLVGFSMGGLVSRYYLQRMDGSQHVRKFITIGSPHQGTLTADLSWLPAITQMRIASDFTTHLNKDVEALLEHDVVSIWTPFDLMIIPRASAKLPVGRSYQVPVLIHHLMLTDDRVLALVEKELS
jgi:triacylglycerol lipase